LICVGGLFIKRQNFPQLYLYLTSLDSVKSFDNIGIA